MVELSRQITVIVITMGIVIFYQYYEDKKNKIKRTNLWSILKLPILVSTIVYLSMNLKSLKPPTITLTGGNIINELAADNLYTELPNW